MLRLVVLAKRLFAISVVTLAMVVASGGSLTAQDSPAPKIGVFNAERIMTESQAGQQALTLFGQLRDQRFSELQAQQEEITNLRQQAMAADPSSPQAAQLQRQLEDRSIQFERLQADVQQELQTRQNELLGEVAQQASGIIEKMGEEGGYTVIFDQTQSGLVFADPALDITGEIVGRLDAVNSADGADAQP